MLKNNTRMKRIITFLLALVVAAGMLPMTVRAVAPSNLYLDEDSGTVGVPFTANLMADGSTPITWTFVTGDWPDGLTLELDGEIHGEPEVAGVFTFTVNAENSYDDEDEEFTITITDVPPTGIPGVTGFAVAGMSFAIAAGALWFVLLRRKVNKQEN